jgi:uncharacterized damage-inducible protein DinB
MSIAVRLMRKLGQNNRLANHRLLTACLALQPGEFEATRVSFFPTIKETLNHILTVDWFYVDALEGGTLGPRAWDPEQPFDAVGPLFEAQVAVDERLLAFVGGLTDAGLGAETRVHRTNRIQVERTDDLLLHLFMHQTHHRGQVHAMLAGSSVKPPQLDEFLTASDFRDRATDMATLGWSEADLGR